MARVRFTDDFDWKPSRMRTIAFKKGMEETVRRECAHAAVEAGKAVEIDAPRRLGDG